MAAEEPSEETKAAYMGKARRATMPRTPYPRITDRAATSRNAAIHPS